MALSLVYSRAASTPVDTFDGDTLAVGTWLYLHGPGGTPDCGVVVEVGEDPPDHVVYDLSFTTGRGRCCPRTRALVRWDGGTADPRWESHIDTATLEGYNESNGLTGYHGFLAARFPDYATRAAFVAHRREAPARRAEEAQRIEDEREADRRNIGPWFRDLTDAIGERDGGGGYVPDTIEAKVIRRAVREIAGVKIKVTVRRYSMASGLEFNGRFSEDEAERINAIFPGIVTRYERRTSDDWNDPARVVTFEACGGLYPRAREDRSDLQSDYHAPGGFRVANAHLIAVSAILSDEVNKASR